MPGFSSWRSTGSRMEQWRVITDFHKIGVSNVYKDRSEPVGRLLLPCATVQLLAYTGEDLKAEPAQVKCSGFVDACGCSCHHHRTCGCHVLSLAYWFTTNAPGFRMLAGSQRALRPR